MQKTIVVLPLPIAKVPIQNEILWAIIMYEGLFFYRAKRKHGLQLNVVLCIYSSQSSASLYATMESTLCT